MYKTIVRTKVFGKKRDVEIFIPEKDSDVIPENVRQIYLEKSWKRDFLALDKLERQDYINKVVAISLESYSSGELFSDHPNRMYIRVLNN